MAPDYREQEGVGRLGLSHKLEVKSQKLEVWNGTFLTSAFCLLPSNFSFL